MSEFDWSAVKSAIERGMTPTEIARTLPNVPTRQAIEKRVAKEGWSIARLPGADANQPVTQRDIVLNHLRNGVTFEIAARAAGVSDRTVRMWREDDPTFEMACQASRAAFVASKIEQINDAPDWKAAAYLLERAPETKDQYGTKQGESPMIVLNITRETPQGITIDGRAIESGKA